MSDLLCVRWRQVFRSTMCPLALEEQVAASLESHVMQYCGAVADRRASLAAADRFYRDLMVYQWRLNALEVQIRAAEELSNAGADVTVILDRSLNELEAQHREAIAAFQERASHYALGAPTKSSGHIKRFAANELERQLAIDHYRDLAKDTFSEILCEARLIGQIDSDEKSLRQFKKALEGRLLFWQTQLEETWVAWHDVTSLMHRTGDEAMAAWKSVVSNLETVRKCLQQTSYKTSLELALAAFAARGLEVELVNSLGLTGLSADLAAEDGPFLVAEFSPEARVRSLVSVFELLRQAGCLHEVGRLLAEALQDPRDQTGVKEMLCKCDSIMPTPHADAAFHNASNYRPMEGKNLFSMDEDSITSTPRTPHAEGAFHQLLQSTSVQLSQLTSSTPTGLDHPSKPSRQLPMLTPTTPLATPATPMASAAVHLATAALTTPNVIVRLANEEPEDEGVSSLIPWLTESLVQATRKAVEEGAGTQLIKLLRLCGSLGNERLASAVYDAATQHSEQRRSFWSQIENEEGENITQELLKLLKPLAEETEDQEDQEDVVVVLPRSRTSSSASP